MRLATLRNPRLDITPRLCHGTTVISVLAEEQLLITGEVMKIMIASLMAVTLTTWSLLANRNANVVEATALVAGATGTMCQVESVSVIPKGVPAGWTPPDPVTIGAGAIHSPAHQADVMIRVLPPVSGIPVDVRVIGGRSYEPGKEAELFMGTQTATGDGAAVTVLTGEGGTISGILTSSDVANMDCTIRAGAKEKNVRFTWDLFDKSGIWADSEDLTTPGMQTNHAVFRHYRDAPESQPANSALWMPFDGHDIRFYVEQVVYRDVDGNTCATNNTADAPADVSAWAFFPTNPVTTDADGRVTELMTIVTNNIVSIKKNAYDCTVFKKPADKKTETHSEGTEAPIEDPSTGSH
jgi:hypothetical protein